MPKAISLRWNDWWPFAETLPVQQMQTYNLSLNPWGNISQRSPVELIEHFLNASLKAAASVCVCWTREQSMGEFFTYKSTSERRSCLSVSLFIAPLWAWEVHSWEWACEEEKKRNRYKTRIIWADAVSRRHLVYTWARSVAVMIQVLQSQINLWHKM